MYHSFFFPFQISGTFDDQGVLALAGCVHLVELTMEPMIEIQTRGVSMNGKSEMRNSTYTDRSISMLLSCCRKLQMLSLRGATEIRGEWSKKRQREKRGRRGERGRTAWDEESKRDMRPSKWEDGPERSSSSQEDHHLLDPLAPSLATLLLFDCDNVMPEAITEFVVKETSNIVRIELTGCDPNKTFNQTRLLAVMPPYTSYVGTQIGVGPLPEKYQIQDVYFEERTRLVIAILKVQKIGRGFLLRRVVQLWNRSALIIECCWRQKVARDAAFDLLTSYRFRVATSFFNKQQARWLRSCYEGWRGEWMRIRDEKIEKAMRFCRRISMKCVVTCLATWKEDWLLRRRIRELGDRVFRGRCNRYFDLWWEGTQSIVNHRVSMFVIPLQALARGFAQRSMSKKRKFVKIVGGRTDQWERRRVGAERIQRIWRGAKCRGDITILCLEKSWIVWSPSSVDGTERRPVRWCNILREQVYEKLHRVRKYFCIAVECVLLVCFLLLVCAAGILICNVFSLFSFLFFSFHFLLFSLGLARGGKTKTFVRGEEEEREGEERSRARGREPNSQRSQCFETDGIKSKKTSSTKKNRGRG